MSARQTDRRGRSDMQDVLIVDDEPDIRELLELSLLRMGLSADTAGSIQAAKSLLAEKNYRLCLTDMRLPDGEGLELVEHVANHISNLPIAVITAFGSMQNAVTALKLGAFDYISKPISLEQLRTLVKSVLELPQKAPQEAMQGLEGEAPSMIEVRRLIERLARSQAPVHIAGESGTGKERAARMIHALSSRNQGPFVAVNCGAIPENLMESEFFGVRKGAFTGADADREGFVQVAQGGTLFLDEVADLPLSMQVKLLRVIQEKRVRRLGDTQEVNVDIRILSATHHNLRVRVEQNLFRQDLFYRLNVIELRMPALRERREDILLLAKSILQRLAQEMNVPCPQLSEAAQQALCSYSFPGNVRELENILERAMALILGTEILATDLQLDPDAPKLAPASSENLDVWSKLQQLEQSLLENASQLNHGDELKAAMALQLSPRSFRLRCQIMSSAGAYNER